MDSTQEDPNFNTPQRCYRCSSERGMVLFQQVDLAISFDDTTRYLYYLRLLSLPTEKIEEATAELDVTL